MWNFLIFDEKHLNGGLIGKLWSGMCVLFISQSYLYLTTKDFDIEQLTNLSAISLYAIFPTLMLYAYTNAKTFRSLKQNKLYLISLILLNISIIFILFQLTKNHLGDSSMFVLLGSLALFFISPAVIAFIFPVTIDLIISLFKNTKLQSETNI